MSADTLFLRLEGPLQAWGTHESKFVVRRTAAAPTKSGVIGMLLAALGVSRDAAPQWLPRLTGLKDGVRVGNGLELGVRVDRPGVRWWDYHTVGAGCGAMTAQGKIKRTASTGEIETLVSRREYLCDASFLVALRGEPELITELYGALQHPKWTLYLGRKCCPPSRPILSHDPASSASMREALCSVPWQPRYKRSGEWPKGNLDCYIDWVPTDDEPTAPQDAEVWYDVPVTLDPPSHHPRFVLHRALTVGPGKDVARDGTLSQSRTLTPPRPRADYKNTEFRKARFNRLYDDENLCVFCKQPATTVQHVTYRRAGGDESREDLRAMCRLCHDAVTMLEYGEGLTTDRIDPADEGQRRDILKKRGEIIRFRSRQRRKERLAAKEDA